MDMGQEAENPPGDEHTESEVQAPAIEAGDEAGTDTHAEADSHMASRVWATLGSSAVLHSTMRSLSI